MPIIAIIVVFALLYWLWPYILALTISAAIYYIYASEKKRRIDSIASKILKKMLKRFLPALTI
jgi:O-antigen/teichoic acid export membrane protein